jgi:hypothetical protein
MHSDHSFSHFLVLYKIISGFVMVETKKIAKSRLFTQHLGE